LPPGIEPQTLSHKTRQLSVTTRAEGRLLTAGPYLIPAASVRSIDRVVWSRVSVHLPGVWRRI